MKILHTMHRVSRRFRQGRTVGARVLVVVDGRILLVRHTYTKGWYSIGGAVEAGESPRTAALRELEEETGLRPETPLHLIGFYYSRGEGRDDYIAVYACDAVTGELRWNPAEIAEAKWFALDDLPEDISPATRRRITDYMAGIAETDVW